MILSNQYFKTAHLEITEVSCATFASERLRAAAEEAEKRIGELT